MIFGLLGRAIASPFGSALGFAFGVVAAWVSISLTVIPAKNRSIEALRSQYVTLLTRAEVDKATQLLEAEAARDLAIEQNEMLAQMLAQEAADNARLTIELEEERRLRIRARTAVENISQALQLEIRRADDVCAAILEPDYIRDGFRELRDATYGHEGGLFDDPDSPVDNPGQELPGSAAVMPRERSASPRADPQ